MFRLERPENQWQSLISQTAGNVAQNRAADMQHQKKAKEIQEVLGPLNDESSAFDWMRAIQSLRHAEPAEKKELFKTIENVNTQKASAKKQAETERRHKEQGIAELKALGINTGMAESQGESPRETVGKQGTVTPLGKGAQVPEGFSTEAYINATPAGRKIMLSPLKQMGGVTAQPIPDEYAQGISEVQDIGAEYTPEQLRAAFNKRKIPAIYTNPIIEDRREAIRVATEKEKTGTKTTQYNQERIDKSKEKNAPFINDIATKLHRFEARTKPTYMAMNAYSDKDVMLSPFFRHLLGPGMSGAIDAYLGDSTAENLKKLENILVGNITQEGYGSRILEIEFQNYMRQIPGLMMSPQGRRKVMAGNLKMGEVNKVLDASAKKLEQKYEDEGTPQPSNFTQLVFDDALPEIQRIGKEAEFIAKLPDERPEPGKSFYITPNGKGIIQIDDTDEERARFEAAGAHPTYLSNPLPQAEQQEEREQEGEAFLKQMEEAENPPQQLPQMQQQPMQPHQEEQQGQASMMTNQNVLPPSQGQQGNAPPPPPSEPSNPNVNPYNPGIREEKISNEKAQQTGQPQPTPSQHGSVELMPNRDPKKEDPKYQQAVEESWLDWSARNFKGVKHEVFKQLCNLPKNVFSLVMETVNSAPKIHKDPFYRWLYGNEKYDTIKNEVNPKDAFPGFEEVKKAVNFIGGREALDMATGIDVEMEPGRTPGEQKGREVVAAMALTGATAPYGLATANRLLWTASPAVGALGGETLKGLGFSEEKARYAETGIELMMNLASIATPIPHLNAQMNQASQVLNPMALSANAESRLLAMQQRNLVHQFPPNSVHNAVARSQAESIIQEITENQAAGRPTTTGQLLNRYNAVNEATEQAGVQELGRHANPRASRSAEILKSEIMETVESNIAATGNQPAAGALDTWQTAMTSRRVMHQSNRMQDTAKAWLDPILKHVTGKIAVLSVTGAGLHMYPLQTAMLFGIGVGGAALHKAGQVAYRCASNPNLLNYYTRSVRDLAAGNKASFLLNYDKLTKMYAKEMKKEEKISTAPKAKPKKKS